MSNWSTYDIASGRPLRRLEMPEGETPPEAMLHSGEGLMEGDLDPEHEWAPDGVREDRPALPATISQTTFAADDEDAVTVAGLPVPCDIAIAGPSGETTVSVDDGELTLTADVAGTYRLSVDQWPFLPWQVEVIAE